MKYHQSFRYKKDGEYIEEAQPNGLLRGSISAYKQRVEDLDRHSGGSENVHTPKYGVEEMKGDHCDAFAKRI